MSQNKSEKYHHDERRIRSRNNLLKYPKEKEHLSSNEKVSNSNFAKKTDDFSAESLNFDTSDDEDQDVKNTLKNRQNQSNQVQEIKDLKKEIYTHSLRARQLD